MRWSICFALCAMLAVISGAGSAFSQDNDVAPAPPPDGTPSDDADSRAALGPSEPMVSVRGFAYPVLNAGPGMRTLGPSLPVIQNRLVPTAPDNMLMQDDRQGPSAPSWGFGFNPLGETVRGGSEPTLVLRTAVLANLAMTYDTGYEKTYSPATIALSGSDLSRQGGIFNMTATSADLETDLGAPGVTGSPQAYIKAYVDNDGLQVRQAYGRAGALLAGKYWTTFGLAAALPGGVLKDLAPAGSIYRPTQAQLQYVLALHNGLGLGVAVEQPTTTDFFSDVDDDVALQRYPDLVARILYEYPDEWSCSQVAVLVRGMGFEDTDFREHFATGWGVSGGTRLRVWNCDSVRFGVVGGAGIGSYIFGLDAGETAAVRTADSFHVLPQLGAYAGYRHYWGEHLWSDFVYGWAQTDASFTVPDDLADATRQSQNAWMDLVWNPRKGVAIGLQYCYGTRDSFDGSSGDNHQVALSLQIGAEPVKQTVATEPASSVRGMSVTSSGATGGRAYRAWDQ